MPIVRRKALRKGLPDITLFRGTIEEAKKIRPDEIDAVFKNRRPVDTYSQNQREVKFATSGQLKEALLDVMRDLEGAADPSSARRYRGLDYQSHRLGLHAVRVLPTPVGRLPFRLTRSARGTFIIRQYPVTHGVRFGMGLGGLETEEKVLRSIVEHGFFGRTSPNVVVSGEAAGKDIGSGKVRYGSSERLRAPFKDDFVNIDFLSPLLGSAFLPYAPSSEISQVRVTLAQHISDEEARERMKRYRQIMPGAPLVFFREKK